MKCNSFLRLPLKVTEISILLIHASGDRLLFLGSCNILRSASVQFRYMRVTHIFKHFIIEYRYAFSFEIQSVILGSHVLKEHYCPRRGIFKIGCVFSDVTIIEEHYCNLEGRGQGCCTNYNT